MKPHDSVKQSRRVGAKQHEIRRSKDGDKTQTTQVIFLNPFKNRTQCNGEQSVAICTEQVNDAVLVNGTAQWMLVMVGQRRRRFSGSSTVQ